MRTVLDASAAANIVLRTDLAPALIEKLERGHLVIAPHCFTAKLPTPSGNMFMPATWTKRRH